MLAQKWSARPPKPCRKPSQNLVENPPKTLQLPERKQWKNKGIFGFWLQKPCRKSFQNLVENRPKTLSKILPKPCRKLRKKYAAGPRCFYIGNAAPPRSCWRISRPPAPARAAGGSGRPFSGPPKSGHCSYSVLQEVGPRHPAFKFGIPLSACSFFSKKLATVYWGLRIQYWYKPPLQLSSLYSPTHSTMTGPFSTCTTGSASLS